MMRQRGRHHGAARARRRALGVAILLGLLGSSISAWLHADETSPERDTPPIVRELYVPQKELLELAARDPSGVVMTLLEYRELLARARARQPRKVVEREPPPVDAVVVSADVQGQVEGDTARFEATLHVVVASEDWVRCDLGPTLPFLGTATLDGAPAWILRHEPSRGAKGGGESRDLLLVRGAGRHTVKLEFAMPIREGEDSWWIDGPVPASQATRLELEVPGRARGTSQPPLLESVWIDPSTNATVRPDAAPAEAAGGEWVTRHLLSVGAAEHVRLQWRLVRGTGRQESRLTAEHKLTYGLQGDDAAFRWRFDATIYQQRTDHLRVALPSGFRVLRGEGEALHSFETIESDLDGVESELSVLLRQPTLGAVSIAFEGLLAEPTSVDTSGAARFELGRPRVVGATRDTGVLLLQPPRGAAIRVLSSDAIEERAVEEVIESVGLPRDRVHESLRGFRFHAPSAALVVRVVPDGLVYDVRSTHRVTVEPRRMALRTGLRARVDSGRLYGFSMTLPAGWRLTSLAESGGDHGLRHSDPVSTADGASQIDVALDRAVLPGGELILGAILERTDIAEPAADWQTVSFDIELPRVPGARRAPTALGLEIPPYLDGTLENVSGWRPLPTERLGEHGFDDGRLIAALEIDGEDDTSPAVSVVLRRRAFRGVYQAVVHALAIEHSLRLRVDVRLAVTGRPVESLAVTLPLDVDEPLYHAIPDLKEIVADADSGRRIVRFQRPWLGERLMRFEFELDLEPGGVGAPAQQLPTVPVPSVTIEPAAAGDADSVQGGFDPTRFVVIGSRGGVEVRVERSDALLPVDLDAVPAFSTPWKEGRTVSTFRWLEGQTGAATPSLGTLLHRRNRDDVLRSGISELALETTLGRDGIARTRASFVLRYSREQHLEVELAAGERIRTATVDGEPVRPVIPAGDAASTFLIPLPPRSYTHLEIVSELDLGPLRGVGSTELRSPRFGGLPISETNWSIYHPADLRVEPRGDAIDSLAARTTHNFASTFWGNVLRLRWPLWVTWQRPPRPELPPAPGAGDPSGAASLTSDGSQAQVPQELEHQQRQQVAAASGNVLVAVQTRDRQAKARSLPVLQALAEGEGVRLRKLGGHAVVELAYADPLHERFFKRGVFLLAIIIGLGLRRWRQRETFWVFAAAAVALATCVPPALGIDGTFFWTPFAEGIILLCAAIGGLALWRRVLAPLARRTARGLRQLVRNVRSGLVRRASLGACMVLAAIVTSAADERPLQTEPVLVPYSLEDFDFEQDPEKTRVYLPHDTFLKLWNTAYPDDAVGDDPDAKAPASIVLGNASYTLRIEERTYRLTGRIDVRTFTNLWTTLPLPVQGAQLAEIRLDGKREGVSYRDGVPFVTIRRPGKHELEVVIEGALVRGIGDASLRAVLLAGRATQVRGELPAGAQLDRRDDGSAHPVSVMPSEPGEPTPFEAHLGHQGVLELRWKARVVESEQPQRISEKVVSTYSLDTDGYTIARRERVQVDGPALERLRFRITGPWTVLEVRGNSVGEWSLLSPTDESGGPSELDVVFNRPARRFDFVVTGFAPLDATPREPAGLELLGAYRSEGFLGLIHHPLRRFPPDVLEGLTRTSPAEISGTFPGEDVESVGYDRVYRHFGPYGDERLRSVAASVDGGLESELIAVVTAEATSVVGRHDYSLSQRAGPLEYVLPLEDGWQVRSVRGTDVLDWEVRDTDGERELRVVFFRRAREGSRVEWVAEAPAADRAAVDSGAATIQFPRFLASTSLRQTQRWSVAASQDIDVSQSASTDMPPLPLERAPRWLRLGEGISYRMGFRSVRDDATLRVGLRRFEPRTRAVATTLFRVDATHVDVNTRVRLAVSRSGIDEIRLRLPAGARLVQAQLVGRPGRQEVVADDTATELVLRLPSAVRGELVVDASYRLDREAGAPIELRASEVVGVQAAQHFVAVLRQPVRQLRVVASQGFTPVDPEAVPQLPTVADDESVLEAFSVVDRSQALVLDEVIPRPSDKEDVVELVEIETVIAADGSNWTIANYQVRNRTRQFLEFLLPPRHRLWRVTVDGRPAAVSRPADRAAVDGDSAPILVPVPRLLETDLSLDVEVVFTLPAAPMPARSVQITPRAPVLLGGHATLETFWRVHVPPGYELGDVDSNLDEIIEGARYGRKVKVLQRQIEHLRAAGETAGKRGRARAERNLLQLEQALRDNVVEIEKSREAFAGRGRIQEDELREQVQETLANQQLGKQLQQQLETRREKMQQAEPQRAVDPVDREFDDAKRFTGNVWTDAPVQSGVRPPGAARATPLRDDTLEPIPVTPQAAPAGEAVQSRAGAFSESAAALSGARLEPLFEGDTAADVGVPRGGTVHTFRRLEGDPELTITLTSTTRAGWILPWLGVLLTLALIVVWWQRRGARATATGTTSRG